MTGRTRDTSYVDFVAARQAHLRRIAYALCGNWHDADDLLQVALTKLYVAWPRVHRTGSEEAYARRVIVRVSIDAHRRRTSRPEIPGLDGLDAATSDSLPVEDRSALFDALQELPERQRKVVVLRHWLGLSVDETAHELGISAGTVKSHSARAMTRLQALLGV